MTLEQFKETPEGKAIWSKIDGLNADEGFKHLCFERVAEAVLPLMNEVVVARQSRRSEMVQLSGHIINGMIQDPNMPVLPEGMVIAEIALNLLIAIDAKLGPESPQQ